MSLHSKMLEVMKNVQYMKKDGKVDFGNTHYKAMTEEKVTSLMRKAMVDQGLVVYPIEQEWSRSGNITHVDVKYRIVDAENPEDFIEVVSCGDGQDTQDKGAGKAMTYAFKYMWLRTFAIPTGEDPDQICNEEIEAKEAEENAKAIVKDISDMKKAEVKIKVLEGDIAAGLSDRDKMLKYFKVENLADVTEEQFRKYVADRDKAQAKKAKK